MSVTRLLSTLLLVVAPLLTAGCDEPEAKDRIGFFGDSLVDMWDLEEYFPALPHSNYGKAGSRVSYLEQFAGSMAGHRAVVLTGTNDMSDITSDNLEAYADRYVATIKALGASRTYLYSILPRDIAGQRPDMNETVIKTNHAIQSRIASDPAVVYLDVHDRFIVGDDIDDDLYTDRLHLSSRGYDVLAQALIKAM